MRPELFCHLPFLRLDGLARLDVDPDTALVALGFDEWLCMEDPAMVQYDRRFASVGPVFATTRLGDGGQAGTLSPEQELQAEDFLDRAHAALVLAMPTVAVAPPALSASYVVWRGLAWQEPDGNGSVGPSHHESEPAANNEGIRIGRVTAWLQQPPPGGGAREQWVVQRWFGPAQREWLLSHYDEPPDPIDADAAGRFAANLRRLHAAGWGHGTYIALPFVDALTSLVTPGTPLPEALVLLVASLENLLNPDGERPLGRVFAARCATWFAETGAQRDADVAIFRALYDARSSIVHGSDAARSLRKLMQAIDGTSDDDLRAWIRLFAWLAIDWLVAWFGREPADDPSGATLRDRLAAAGEMEGEHWQAARADLVAGRSYARG